MSFNRKALSGSALVVLGVLFVAVLLLVNVALRGARIDLTQGRLYTLSDGTRNILKSIDEPINLYFFWSDKGSQEIPQVRAYATRVREMLEEMASHANGKLHLQFIDPLPFSEDEDRAASMGLQAIPVSAAGDKIFLGIAGTNSTNGQASIPFLQPDKEAFLEYDLAKLIHQLEVPNKPVVGLLTGLPIEADFDPATRQMRPAWAVDQQWRQLFEVRKLDGATLKSIDKDISVLILVQPKKLPDDALYAIDQFVLRGGHLLAFIDPDAQMDQSGADPNNPMAAMMADKSSDLPKLFKAWHIDYDPHKVVIDRARALSISMGEAQAPVRHPAILGLGEDDFNHEDVVTANLATINLSTAGFIELAKGAKGEKLEPLLQTSSDASSVASDRLRMLADPASLLADYTPAGSPFVIAGRLSGLLDSAFPERKGPDHLAQSKQDAQVVIVADTDILSDRMWVQVRSFLGQSLMNAFANNGDFAVNLVDNLAGSGDLIAIRGRATAQRPFTTVEAIKRSADERFRAKEQDLQRELSDTERKLTELQSGKSQDQAMVLSPEQKGELDKFLKRKVEIRKELRAVRRQLDAQIESLGTRLKIINILLMPLLVTLAALGFAWWRAQRRRAAQGGKS
ncbi:MAG: Gldg family protein [Dokdonella sp.]|uniref:GldG family protein n=1 Tax=Dokdonella sp. TaxID=2291710 RepID=UPI0025C16448|nr:Gldg family protein [Dokdonella sp.]MBZ0221563.1 Gldg family protein [Dokdonella sp.]